MDLLVNIDVADLAAAEKFYSQGLGLQAARRLGPSVLEMVGASARIYLLAKDEGSAALARKSSPQRSYRRHWTPVHLDFVCDDVHAAVERACKAGALLEQPIASHAWGHIAVLSDPWGHGFCIIQFTELGYDAIAS